MSRTLADGLRWADEGTSLVRRAVATLGADEAVWEAPSALPGWNRKNLLAHVNGNALALRNLATWASTRVETPMYTSTDQRNADIAAGALVPGTELIAAFEATAAALASDWEGLSEQNWQAPVVTAQGRTVPASETPWMRTREVMVHAVDLDAGLTFAELPADFNAALITDIVGKRSLGGNPAVQVVPNDHDEQWQITGDGEPVVVTGPLAQLTAWLAGRSHSDLGTESGALPELPAWL